MEREIITSKANSLLSRVRKLNSRRAFRRAEGAFAAEGPKLLGEALRWGVEVEAVICAPGVPLLELPAQVRVAEVGDALLASIADTQSPQGIVFICKGKNLALPDPLGGSRYLLLDGVQDPGNVGTIWRTADAFGAEGLILCNGCADPWNPKTVRATMGAVFRLPHTNVRWRRRQGGWSGRAYPCMRQPSRRTQQTCGRFAWTGRRWLSAARAGGYPGRRWTIARKQSGFPCESGVNR